MSDEKKRGLFDDVEDVFNGIANVVSGKVFSKEAWTKAVPKPLEVKAAHGDADEEIEEVRTVRRRKGGTFAAAPKAKSAGDGDDGKPGVIERIVGSGQPGATEAGAGTTEGK